MGECDLLLQHKYQSPDGPPLSNGKKPSLRACKEDDNSFEAKAPRIRSGSVSGLANPSPSPDHHHFSHFSISSDLPRPENQTASSPSASSSPNANNAHHDLNVGSPRREGGGDGLPQWGQRKRSRGARGDESSAHPRIQRRVVNGARLAGAAPQPFPPYSRSANLRPSLAARDPTTRSANERSSGPSRPEKRRSPLSPPEKSNEMAPAATDFVPNGCTAVFPSVNLENLPPPPSDQGITGGGSSAVAEKPRLDQMQWPRIYLTLSRKEKEDDFLAMKGAKLPQRPKKRPKNVDKILQYCSPGMWLSDLTRSRYEVREKKCVKKKRRGLKGMESMDTDSE